MNNNILRKSGNIIFGIVTFLFTLFMIFKTDSFADENHEKGKIKIGYYENETFQEGASDAEVKTGYSYEYLQKIASINGWKYEYIYGPWTEMYDAFVNGEVDLLAGLGYSETRLDKMNYPDYPMGYESYYLFARGENATVSEDYNSLKDKKIGTIPGLMETTGKEWLKDHDINAEIVLFKDVADRDNALAKGLIDAFIGEGASVSSKNNVIPIFKIKNVEMYLCVSKERTDLLDELNLALAELDSKEPYYISDLSKKYFSNNAVSLLVSGSEAEWLNSHDNTVIVGYMDDFLPYCGTDENGNATGIMVDILKAGFNNIVYKEPIKIEYRAFSSSQDMIDAVHAHEVELIFPISNDIYFLEQNNLYHSKDVITSAMNYVYRGNLDEAQEKPLAINRNNQIQYNYAFNYFSESEIIMYETVEDCLNAVVKGDAGGAILSGLRASTLLGKSDYSELLYAELPYSTVKCFGISTSHKGILPLINQALNSLDDKDAMTYTYKYLDHATDYSIHEFMKRNAVTLSVVIILVITVGVWFVANYMVKNSKQKLYYEFAYKDGLTRLYNRRSYEEDLEKFSMSMLDNLVCVSMDLTGLKRVNDNYGHAAGDELIIEAGRLITESFGKFGRIYRTGGDEYFALLRTDYTEYEKTKEELNRLCSDWKGKYSSEMQIAVGAATAKDAKSNDVMDICKLADKRMYEAKSAWYRLRGVDRNGQASAHAALYKLYTKIFKINLTDDSHMIVNIDSGEEEENKGYSESISEWFKKFGYSGQVHPDDLDNYLKLTDLDYLKSYFHDGKTSISIHYRRNYEGTYKQVIMEMIPADDYTDDNQSLFLYVKLIDR